MTTRTVPFTDGMEIGLGYNRLTGDRLPTPAVQGSSITTMQGAGGQVVTSNCTTMKDVATLHKSIGLEIDAGGAYMGASGSAKTTYAESCDFSSFSTYVMVHVKVANATETLDSPVFSPDAAELLVNGNPDRFRQRFGDTFIAGVLRGGEYFAIYQITGSDESEKESLAGKINAAYQGGIASASLSVAITNATSSSRSHLSVSCQVFRQGTVSTADLTVEDILATAKQFPIGVSGDKAFPYAVCASRLRWSEVSQRQVRLCRHSGTPGRSRGPGQEAVRVPLAQRRSRLHPQARRGLSKRRGSPVGREGLLADFDAVVSAINTMQDEARACTKDAEQCKFTKFDVATLKVPTLRKTDKIPLIAGPHSWPRDLAMQVVGTSNDFSISVKLLTDFTEQKTAGFMGIGLALCSENNDRVALLLKGVGSGGRGIRGGIHALPGADGIEIGRAQAYGEDDVHPRMSKKGDQLVEMAFSRNGEDWSVFAANVDLAASGFAAGGKYKVALAGYSTCELPVSGKFSEIKVASI